MIKFTNVFKAFPKGGLALKDVSFHVGKGEFAFLTGHSGAGKSTILRLVALIDRPTRGQVVVNRANTTEVRRRAIPAFRLALRMKQAFIKQFNLRNYWHYDCQFSIRRG